MKRLEREMKGEDADATDDEVCVSHASAMLQANVFRTTFYHLLTQMSHIMMLKIALAQNTPHVAGLMLRPIKSLKMTRGGRGSLWPELPSSQRMKTQTIRSKMSQADTLSLLVPTVTKQLLITT
jgi:hypothetical protein